MYVLLHIFKYARVGSVVANKFSLLGERGHSALQDRTSFNCENDVRITAPTGALPRQ